MMRIVEARVDGVAAAFPRPLLMQAAPMTVNTAVVVHLEEAGGALGFGYAPTFGFGTGALRALIEDDLAPLVTGIDLESVGDGVRRMTDAAEVAGRPAGMARQGSAVVEMALWDVAGQLQGRALHALWGQAAEPVRAYASGGWRYLPIEDLSKLAGSWVAEGFDGVKIQVGLSPREDAERLRAVREVVGPAVHLMLDANQRMSPSAAQDWARSLAAFDPTWLEEPIPASCHEELAAVHAAVAVPIAAGESESEPSGLQDLLDRRAVDVLQPDVQRAGLGTAHEIRTRALECHASLSPHLAHELGAHLLTGVAGDGWLEYFDWFDDWWETPNVPSGGRMTPATVPGHGLRLRAGWLEAHRI
jgi:L-alanine-DL-glutamate epimerase-like enolase superfamily enzyme